MWVLGPPTLPPKTLIVLLITVIFCFSQRRDYLYISHSNKGRSYYSLYQIQYKRFSSGSDCRCGASPSLPTSLIKLILGDTGMMWCLGHLRIIANNILWWHHSVIILHLVLLLDIHLLLHLVMVEVLWFVGPPTWTPKRCILLLWWWLCVIIE